MSWYDWFSNAVAQGDGLGAVPAPSPYAAQNVPQPPQRPDAGLYAPTPMPPQRPGNGASLYPPMPQPPSRPDGIVPMNPNRPIYGDPTVILPSELPGIPTNGAPNLPPVLGPRNVPMPPQRPSSFAVAQQPRRADLPAPGARPASFTPTPAAQPSQAPQAPHQPPQAPEGYRYVLQPIDGATQAPASGAQASTPSIWGANVPAGGGLFNALSGQQGNPHAVGANGPEIPQATGLAAALGAQPSMQAQQSTGPTAYLDRLFGFRG